VNLPALIADLLNLLSITSVSGADAPTLGRAVDAVNASLQTMQAGGEDYFGRETATLAASPDSATFAATVQTVIGPVRLASGGPPLRKLGSRTEHALFPDLYGGPAHRAYWVEAKAVAGSDPTSAIIHFTPPKGTGTTNYSVDIIADAPRYTVANVTAPIPLEIPVPHKYVESILRPLARYRMTADRYFSRPDLLDSLAGDHDRAMILLGLADPRRPKPFESRDRTPPARGAQPQEAAA
jgi:hypothetical protein